MKDFCFCWDYKVSSVAPYLVVLPFGGAFFLLILRRRPVNLDKDEREREWRVKGAHLQDRCRPSAQAELDQQAGGKKNNLILRARAVFGSSLHFHQNRPGAAGKRWREANKPSSTVPLPPWKDLQ